MVSGRRTLTEAELLRAASQALRSYQHGNASPELAEEVADSIDAALAAGDDLDAVNRILATLRSIPLPRDGEELVEIDARIAERLRTGVPFWLGALTAYRFVQPAAATPASLRALGEWFDDPNESPGIAVVRPIPGYDGNVTPGYLLRCIADAFELAIGEIDATEQESGSFRPYRVTREGARSAERPR